jgi:hypothetical protein
MELRDSHKLEFPEQLADYLHVIPGSELDRRIRAGVFHTVQVCSEERIQELGLDRLFLHKAEFGECGVFWDRSTVAK